MPKIIKQSKTSAGGLLLELIGFALLFLFPVGTVMGISLIIAGASSGGRFVCSDCGTELTGKKVKLCPGCRMFFNRYGDQ